MGKLKTQPTTVSTSHGFEQHVDSQSCGELCNWYRSYLSTEIFEALEAVDLAYEERTASGPRKNPRSFKNSPVQGRRFLGKVTDERRVHSGQ